jgi:hypothetical protein
LVEQIVTLCRDSGLRERAGAIGHRHIAENYTLDGTLDATFRAYGLGVS